jgi:hypothetical protein
MPVRPSRLSKFAAGTYRLDLEEGERQIVVLALAELALSRPGWDPAAIRPIVERVDPEFVLYESFKTANADRFHLGLEESMVHKVEHVLMRCAEAEVDGESVLRPELLEAVREARQLLNRSI